MTISKKHILRDPEYVHHCCVPWSTTWHNWNEMTAQALELFGLPGDRYITDIDEHRMIYSFRSDRDAVLFRLKFGEVVR